VLLARPEERRRYIDEAGIAKHCCRKSAERKLTVRSTCPSRRRADRPAGS
jgi:DNA-directed RNA polymerase subunit N (RpoN/RPB10)